ncbi:MAG: iron complex outerrane recepter protein [Sphingomonadales bacterium]|nr:iron complex outerrane recepter protein [Sphingomonadales bacterium]
MVSRKAFALALLAGTASAPLLAQEAPPPQATQTPPPPAAAVEPAQPEPAASPDPAAEPESEDEEGETIVVTGQRQRGAVIGDIAPEVQFDRREIRSLGAGSLSELLDAIAPQTRSGQGRGDERPVILLNGRRISGFSEIRDIPPEAIVRIDVMPEEVALKYGYRPDQKVVNFVLRRRFNAYTTEVQAGIATEGGRESYGAELNYLQINNAGRVNLGAEYRRAEPLFESQRDIVQAEPVPGIELGRFRTLLPQTDQLQLSGTLNRAVSEDVSATLNATFDVNSSTAFLGLPRPSLAPPGLRRDSDSRAGHLGLSVNGAIAPWQWSLTGNLDRNASETETQTSFGLDRSRSVSEVGNTELLLNGPLFDLPGGQVMAAARAGFDAQGLTSRSDRAGLFTVRDLARTREHAQINIDIPIANRRRAALTALGNLSANLNAEVEHLSDFGTLRTLGAGLNWSPLSQVSLIASITDEDGAPSMQQLGDPMQLTPGVRVFDFVRGETVEVTRIDGGNPALVADNRRVWKLGANVRPLAKTDLSLSANYTSTRIVNAISGFPAATAEIEAAFPDRFKRSDGRLVLIDTRPVNFARQDRSELRWGFNLSLPIGPQPKPGQGRGGFGRGGQGAAGAAAAPAPGAASGQAASAQPAQGERPQGEGARGDRGPREGGGAGGPGGGRGGFGGGGRGGFGGGGRGGFGGGGGRLQLAVYHTWHFTDSVLIRPGVPELDFLNGSAGSSSGGRPRHELEFQGGLFKNGLGARLTANWHSGTFVRGGALAGGGSGDDLFFNDFTAVNLRLFADLGLQPFAREHPFLRGMRVSLSIDNLFDSRQQVRDRLGTTPISYQPGYLDPLGRSVRLSVRKLFF